MFVQVKYTALHRTCWEGGDTMTVELLLNKGADVMARANVSKLTCSYCDVKFVWIIFHMTFNKTCSMVFVQDEYTPFLLACQKGFLSIVKLLISKFGADALMKGVVNKVTLLQWWMHVAHGMQLQCAQLRCQSKYCI